jgi:predicted RNA-binding Zn ribbon-like protein
MLRTKLTADPRRFVAELLMKLNRAELDVLFPEVPKKERDHLGRLFRFLAEKGRLPPREAEDLCEVVRQDVSFRTQVVSRSGRATITHEPICKTPYAEAAFALLWLSEQGATGVRVVACKHCGKLFLHNHRGRGRPRLFCSPERCGNAFAQAAYRERNG